MVSALSRVLGQLETKATIYSKKRKLWVCRKIVWDTPGGKDCERRLNNLFRIGLLRRDHLGEQLSRAAECELRFAAPVFMAGFFSLVSPRTRALGRLSLEHLSGPRD